VTSPLRLWPLAFAAIGAAGLGYAIWQWTRPADEPIEVESEEPPVVAPTENEHYEKARQHYVDQYATYAGVVKAGTPDVLKMPIGFRVPVVKVWHEPGDFVKKGDRLMSFHREQIEKAIERADAEGKADDAKRFRGYLELADLKAPYDCVVVTVDRTLGEVPLDEGIGVMTIANPAGFRFTAQIPGEVQRVATPIGTKFDVELDADKGTAKGSVAEFRPAAGTDVNIVLSLEPHEGLEENLAGTIRVASGRQEAALVPKAAIVRRGDVQVLRVWDPESRSITDRTIKLGDETGPDVVVLAGVFPGDSIVVPGPKPKQ
jgi:hypothetical protein